MLYLAGPTIPEYPQVCPGLAPGLYFDWTASLISSGITQVYLCYRIPCMLKVFNQDRFVFNLLLTCLWVQITAQKKRARKRRMAEISSLRNPLLTGKRKVVN